MCQTERQGSSLERIVGLHEPTDDKKMLASLQERHVRSSLLLRSTELIHVFLHCI